MKPKTFQIKVRVRLATTEPRLPSVDLATVAANGDYAAVELHNVGVVSPGGLDIILHLRGGIEAQLGVSRRCSSKGRHGLASAVS